MLNKKVFIGVSALLLSGCTTVLTANETAPEINIASKPTEISIAVLDKRAYVVDSDKEPAFEGIIRSGFGIPYSYYTTTKEPMSVYLTNRLSAGFDKNGIKANVVKTDPTMSVENIVDSLSKDDLKSVLFVLHEWKYDFHTFTDNSWYDMDVIIVDKFGNKKIVKNFKGENDIPDGSLISNEMQLIYKQRFEKVFADPEVRLAFSQ
ncbi:hypothetical protein AKG98_3830 [Moritella sp. JT01]|uniref:hypothetical protein n=1 Tax=Moritella sp. JT01 TaxID=756698 RepID=UPI000794FE79|nr:hypothetical protein [Moritella sp. JT01]KXO12635.1 hypothetical protein AKG98_3830 [Moritella sp. JT01]